MILPSLFNPSNDMALAANVREYVPPKRIQQMEDDLSALAQVWEGTRFAGPWGWSMATKRRFERMGIPSAELPADGWLQEVRRLSSREFACGYIKGLLHEVSDDRLLGQDMAFVDSAALSVSDKIPQSVSDKIPLSVSDKFPLSIFAEKAHADAAPLIFKSPWSSSGRGVFVAEKYDGQTMARLQGFMHTQGGFLVDRFYANKTLDFAMEFFINPDHSVDFLGYSVFHAATTGAYGFNFVESQEELMQRIDMDPSLLCQLIDYHTKRLSAIAYHGAVGIDMLKCADGHIHPCIEINLRMNMGILSLLLHQRYGSQCSIALTPSRLHGFQAVVEDGKLMILYKK